MLRYSSNDQLIINPGTIGQPFYRWGKFGSDLRAQYAILEIDETGIAEVRFKKVFYDVENELKRAIIHKLPYFDLYREMLETGKTHTHDIELLQKLNDRHNYTDEIHNFFEKNYW